MKRSTTWFLTLLVNLALVLGLPTLTLAADDDAGDSAEILTVTASIDPKDLPDLADPDELFAGYVNKTFEIEDEQLAFGHTDDTRLASSYDEDELYVQSDSVAGELVLRDKEQQIYDILVANIKKVADGKLGSTIFTKDDEQNLSDIEFTATDLTDITGIEVPSIINGNEASAEAKQALGAILTRVHKSIVGSIPYELYWYDKTSTGGFQYTYGGNSSSLYISSVYMFVSADYSLSEQTGTCEANTSKTGAATNAASRAAAVVDSYELLTDYKKLAAYKDWIIQAVDYNKLATQEPKPSYGNPWQLIWVFDDNPQTEVVCEGYSKAFKYLCDKSNWNDSAFSCVLATGDMTSSTSSGGHMWNVVSLSNKNSSLTKNYLVDVTNSEYTLNGTSLSYSPGWLGQLFLAGASYNSNTNIYTVSWGSYHYEGWSNEFHGDSVTYKYDDDTLLVYGNSSTGSGGIAGTVLELSSDSFDPTTAVDYIEPSTDGSASMGVTLTLADSIDINFYIGNFAENTDASSYTLTYSFAGSEETVQLSDAQLVDGKRKVKVASCAAKQMADEVSYTLKYNEDVLFNSTYSIKQYCESTIKKRGDSTRAEDQALVKLCKATLDYGTAAQTLFNYPDSSLAVGSLANGGVYDPDLATLNKPNEYDIARSLREDDITSLIATLTLESYTKLNFYVAGTGLTSESITVNRGNSSSSEPASFEKVAQDDGTIKVTVSDIAARDLGTPYTLHFNTASGSNWVTYSPMTYATRNWGETTSSFESLGSVNVASRALYRYYTTAQAYFAAAHPTN